MRASLALFLLLPVIGGCSGTKPVAPWEKGCLARPEMAFELDPLDDAYSEQTYFSKEAASGGGGVAGGGCGCN